MKVYYVHRISPAGDFGTVDIPEKDLEETLKQNPTWKVIEEKEQVEKVEISCPICDRVFQSEHGLLIHKRSHLR